MAAMTDRALAAHELLALRAAWKLDHGFKYSDLSQSELNAVAFLLTPGGCHACPPAAPIHP